MEDSGCVERVVLVVVVVMGGSEGPGELRGVASCLGEVDHHDSHGISCVVFADLERGRVVRWVGLNERCRVQGVGRRKV